MDADKHMNLFIS